MQPGTVTECGLKISSDLMPLAAYHAAVAAAGAQPDALNAIGAANPGLWIRAKQSPPIPVMAGSTTPRTAAAVMAASMALPPLRIISTAARVASGCEVAHMALRAMTGERPG